MFVPKARDVIRPELLSDGEIWGAERHQPVLEQGLDLEVRIEVLAICDADIHVVIFEVDGIRLGPKLDPMIRNAFGE